MLFCNLFESFNKWQDIVIVSFCNKNGIHNDVETKDEFKKEKQWN